MGRSEQLELRNDIKVLPRSQSDFRIEATFEQTKSDLLQRFHDLWAELHSKQDPNQAWFDDWLSRVPNFGCACQDNFRKYVKDNPPDFGDFYRWSVDAHNFVNAKLSKPIWTSVR